MSDTKAELEAKIAALQAALEEEQEKSAILEAEIPKELREGWVITTPNANYSGITAGVLFENGRGFVPKSLKNGDLIVKRLVNDFGYKAAEQIPNGHIQERSPVG